MPVTLKLLDWARELNEGPPLYATFGCHPSDFCEWNDEWREALRGALRHPSTIGVGECGLDYCKTGALGWDAQRTVFN